MTLTDKNSDFAPDQVVHEVEFKGSRRDYFLCPENITPKASDYVIVQADRGEHIGKFVRSAPRSHFPQIKDLKNILRIASYTDVEIMMDNRRKEDEAFEVGLRKIGVHELKMKLVDVEYQFDGNKICFYFTADKRIDFRALVKDLAAEYRTRIELRQIGVRDEARRLGGIGVCGRALCCKTFLGQFEPITSQMARDQNLSLSPSKISGLCGRLMCCLAFEENFYKLRAAVPEKGMIIEKDGRQFEVMRVENEFFTISNGDNTEINLGVGEFAAYAVIQFAGSPDDDKCGKCCNGDDKPCNKPEETPEEETQKDDIEAIPE